MAKVLLVVFSVFCWNISIAQKASEKQYQDVVYTNNEIWGLTAVGEIKVFDLTGNAAKAPVFRKIVAITKDRQGNILVADSANKIVSIDPRNLTTSNIGEGSSLIFGLITTNSNRLFALTRMGIEDVTTHKTWVPDSNIRYNHGYKIKPGYLGRPYTWMVDSKDNLWIGFGFGEWGGDLLIFNTISKEFVRWKINQQDKFIDPVKSITEGNGVMYISTSVHHGFIFSKLLKMEDFTASIIFDGSSYVDNADDEGQKNDDEQYLGPVAYNNYNKALYFYSENGFFKAFPGKSDLTKMKSWKRILKPKLHWQGGESYAAGYRMNLVKFEFTDQDRFIIATVADGIGYYNGKRLKMFQ